MTPVEIRKLAKSLHQLDGGALNTAIEKTSEVLNATADMMESKTYFATLNAVTLIEDIKP